jgi:histidinol-phosphatase
LNPEWKSRYEAAIEAATEAGQLALRYFDTQLEVEWKADQSPVTIADREAEALIRDRLQRYFPGDAFLGEEQGDTPGTTGYRWIVDPIDGTKNFVRGIPFWGALLGLEYRGEMIAGVAYMPTLRQTFRALRGDGAYRDERRIRVSDVATLETSHVVYSSITWFVRAGRERQFVDLLCRTARQRGYGDFYGFVLVAQGSADVMLEHGVHPWDIAAVQPIVEEAGGRFTNWSNQHDIFAPDVLASNGRLHDAALAALAT